jgi:Lsr2
VCCRTGYQLVSESRRTCCVLVLFPRRHQRPCGRRVLRLGVPFDEYRFTQAARKTGSRRAGRGRASHSGGPSTREVREWARQQGIQVNERGRIPADVVAKYEEAKIS